MAVFSRLHNFFARVRPIAFFDFAQYTGFVQNRGRKGEPHLKVKNAPLKPEEYFPRLSDRMLPSLLNSYKILEFEGV